MVLSRGHRKSGLKDVSMHNSNFVLVKGVVEYLDKILLQRKKWG